MNIVNEHNDLDQFLREKFEGHTIEPAEDLWKGIEQRFAPQVVPIRKYSRLKMALYSSAAVIAGLVVMIVLLKTEKSNVSKEEVSEFIKENSNPVNIPDTQNPNEKEIENFVPEIQENKAAFTEIRSIPVQQEKFQDSENEITKTENIQESNYHLALLPAKTIAADEFNFFTHSFNNNLETVPSQPIKPETTKSVKPAHSKNKLHRVNSHSKRRNISAKKYYAQKSKKRNSGKTGNFWEDFDLRANLSPTLSSRSLNNRQNVSVMDYNQNFYNEIEKGQITLNGGLELAYNFSSNWSMYSGLKLTKYSQHTQTIKNQYEIVSANEISVPASAGNIGMTGAEIGQLSPQSEVGTYLKLQYIDVPVVARYKMSDRFYFDAGMKFSYLLNDKTTGKIMDSDAKIQVNKITGLQKNNFGIIFGAGMEHTSSSGFRYEFGPEISLNLTKINPSANVISKPVFIGLRTSIYFGKYSRQ